MILLDYVILGKYNDNFSLKILNQQEPRMDTNGHEFLTTKHTKHTKMPRRRAVSRLKDLFE